MANQIFTLDKKFDLKKIKLDLTKQLNLAGQIVKKDHFQRLEKGMGVKDKLQPSKKTEGKTLVDTGKMRNLVVKKATRKKQEVVIHPGKTQRYPGKNVTMADVGLFHQEGMGRLPKREWFGITEKVEKDILKVVEEQIERELKRA